MNRILKNKQTNLMYNYKETQSLEYICILYYSEIILSDTATKANA